MKKECNALSLVFIFLFQPTPPPPPQKKKQRKVATVSGTGRNDENGPRGENANRGPERHEKTIHHPVRPGREKILLSYSTNKTVL